MKIFNASTRTTSAVAGVATCRVAPMWPVANERVALELNSVQGSIQGYVRMPLMVTDTHAAPRTKDLFGPGIRAKEPPA